MKKIKYTKADVSKTMDKLREKISDLQKEMYQHEVDFGQHQGWHKMKKQLDNYEEQYEILQAAWSKCDWAEKTGLPISDDTTLYITINTVEKPCTAAYMYHCNYCHTEIFSQEKYECVECPKCQKYIRVACNIKMRIEREDDYDL